MSYPAAEDEKRLLAHAAEATTQLADSQTRRHCCRRRSANLKRAFHFAATLLFVVACSVMAMGLASLTVGSLRHISPSCSKHAASHSSAAAQAHSAVSPAKVNAASDANAANAASAASAAKAAKAQNAGPVVVADAALPMSPASSFSRLIDAVSPDTLHELLHEYFPEMYKHGVYPSEKSALEVIHRKNAALATSIAQLARRDLNATVTPSSASSVPVSTPSSSVLPTSSAALPTSSAPVSTAAPTTSSAPTSSAAATTTPSTAASTASGTTTTTSHSTRSTTETPTATGKKVTSVYTSTINGTPTVVTATSVVGVAATNSASTTTATGSLQTNAAMPLLSGSHAQLAKAVAGVVVGAMLI